MPTPKCSPTHSAGTSRATSVDLYGFDYRWLDTHPPSASMEWPFPIPAELLTSGASSDSDDVSSSASASASASASDRPSSLFDSSSVTRSHSRGSHLPRANTAPRAGARGKHRSSESVRERDRELASLEHENLQLKLIAYNLREQCKAHERDCTRECEERRRMEAELKEATDRLREVERDLHARMDAASARVRDAERRAARECSTNKTLRAMVGDQRAALRRAIDGWRATVSELDELRNGWSVVDVLADGVLERAGVKAADTVAGAGASASASTIPSSSIAAGAGAGDIVQPTTSTMPIGRSAAA